MKLTCTDTILVKKNPGNPARKGHTTIHSNKLPKYVWLKPQGWLRREKLVGLLTSFKLKF